MWSLDFVADQLADGKRFRSLTVGDIYAEKGTSMSKLVVELALGIELAFGTIFCDRVVQR